MSASSQDKFQLVGNETSTTLASNYTSGGTTVTVGSTAGWPTTTGVTFAIDSVTLVGTAEVQTPGTLTLYHGVVSNGTTISNVVLASESPNSAQNYAAGSLTRVYMPVSAARHNRIVEGVLTSLDQDGTLKAGAVDVAAVLASDVVETAKIKDGAVTPDKQNATTYTGTMSAGGVTTSYTNVASQVLPSVTAAHKYLITASFTMTHAGLAAVRDYTASIREGTNTLGTARYSAMSSSYLFAISTSCIFTSSASGGQTINFSVLRSTDNGGTVDTASHWTIVDLGRA